ncbi:MAG: M14 family zinc carboxypeptidase [bacterium]
MEGKAAAGGLPRPFEKYHTPGSLEIFLETLGDGAFAPVRVETIGRTVEGRDIRAVGIGDTGSGLPGVLYLSGVHGIEFIGVETSVALMRWFARGNDRGRAERILAGCAPWFVPVLNVDAYERNAESLRRWRVAFSRTNANGVDLNRNYPYGFHARGRGLFTGSGAKISPFYRGPAPLSEPESIALDGFVRRGNFKVSASLHSFGRLIGYPYCCKPERARDHDLLQGLALEMRGRQKYSAYRVSQEYFFIPTSGDTNDWLYEEHGILPFLVEIGGLNLKFWNPLTWANGFYWCNPVDVEYHVENNLEALIFLAEWVSGGAGPLPTRIPPV